MSCKRSSRFEDQIAPFSSLCSDVISQQVLETNHTTTINVYKLNYVAIILCLGCFAVVMAVITCLWRGKRVRNLKPPVLVIYYLCKTAYKPEHAKLCMTLIGKEDYDVNYVHSSVELSLFLCGCLSGNAELIAFMVKRGANVLSISRCNDSALYLALSRLKPNTSLFKALDILLDAGCDINCQNNNGFTALHLACSRGHLSLVMYLLKNGADPMILTLNEVLPHDLALANGYKEVADYVLNKMKNNQPSSNSSHTL